MKEAAIRAENERRIAEMERKRLRMELAEKEGLCRLAFPHRRRPRPLSLPATRNGRGILRPRNAGSRGLEDRVEVPFEKLAVRPVALPVRQRDQLPCLRVELLTVAELVPQPRADSQPVRRIDT